MTALKDIVEAARAGTTPVQALLQERAAKSATGKKSTLRDVEEKMKSIRVLPKSINPQATKAKAAAARQVRLSHNCLIMINGHYEQREPGMVGINTKK